MCVCVCVEVSLYRFPRCVCERREGREGVEVCDDQDSACSVAR